MIYYDVWEFVPNQISGLLERVMATGGLWLVGGAAKEFAKVPKEADRTKVRDWDFVITDEVDAELLHGALFLEPTACTAPRLNTFGGYKFDVADQTLDADMKLVNKTRQVDLWRVKSISSYLTTVPYAHHGVAINTLTDCVLATSEFNSWEYGASPKLVESRDVGDPALCSDGGASLADTLATL